MLGTSAGIAALLLSPGICRAAPNTRASSVLDAIVMAEDYFAGVPVFAADREPDAAFNECIALWKLH